MAEIIEWLKANWAYILSAFCGVVLVASTIVGMTPTTEDDSFMRKVIDFLDKFSIVKTADDKEIIRQAETKLKNEETKG